jgi:hypothetical protein
MAWTLPDDGEGDSTIQSILFQEYMDVLVAGINGIDCVLSGCAVTGSAGMTPAVAKGGVLSNGTMFAVAAANATITAADATNPRIDLIVITSAGAIAVRAGTAAAAPKPAAKTANDVVLAAVYVPENDTAIATSQCIDMRVLRQQGPIVIHKTTTAVVVNNDVAIRTYLTVTMPDGLMATGKTLRVRCGGTYLFNAATLPTAILTIAFGGTTMFADTQIIATADADRGAWWLNFDIVQQGASDQQLMGMGIMTNVVTAAHVPPTAGQAGNMAGSLAVANRPVSWEMAGTAAVNTDNANRALTVQWTMGGTASASNEITLESSTAELL